MERFLYLSVRALNLLDELPFTAYFREDTNEGDPIFVAMRQPQDIFHRGKSVPSVQSENDDRKRPASVQAPNGPALEREQFPVPGSCSFGKNHRALPVTQTVREPVKLMHGPGVFAVPPDQGVALHAEYTRYGGKPALKLRLCHESDGMEPEGRHDRGYIDHALVICHNYHLGRKRFFPDVDAESDTHGEGGEGAECSGPTGYVAIYIIPCPAPAYANEYLVVQIPPEEAGEDQQKKQKSTHLPGSVYGITHVVKRVD